MAFNELPDATEGSFAEMFRHLGSSISGRTRNDFVRALGTQPSDFAGFLAETGLSAWPGWLAGRGEIPAHPRFDRWWTAARHSLKRLRHATAEARRALEHAGIESRPLKGLAIAERLYPVPEMRPVTDIDLLVAAGDVGDAGRILAEQGWRPLTRGVPSGNFEQTFRGPDKTLLDLHMDLAPRWRIPWTGAEELLAVAEGSEAAFIVHAHHALAHFAQHKGHLRPVQEVDLVLLTQAGLLHRPPSSLCPAAELWRQRYRAFWGGTLPRFSPRGPLLQTVYRADRWHPLPFPFRLRHRLLGLLLASRPAGWLAQLAGRAGKAPV